MTILSLISTLNRQWTRSRHIANHFCNICDYIHTVWITTCHIRVHYRLFSAISPVTTDSLESLFVPFVSLWLNHRLGALGVLVG